MSDSTGNGVQLHELTEGTFLFCSPQGNILFGCPPEILKRILSSHLPMPDTIVVPEKLHHIHSSQASLEFPLYHFLFVQRGMERKRKFQVVANPTQNKGLAELLRVTVLGPTQEEMIKAGLPKERAAEIHLETTHMSLKNSANGDQPYRIEEMIQFHPLSAGENCEVYAAQEGMPSVLIERQGDTRFRVLYGEEAHDIEMKVTREQSPNYKIAHRPFDKSKGKFTLTVLGRSNGFDPNDPANGYLLNVDGKVILWDCPAYLHWHLSALKLDPGEIDAFILSHVHEDHIDVSESIRNPPFELYTTPEIYFSMLLKLAAVYDCTPMEARKYHNWHVIDVAKPVMEIEGISFEFFHAVHAIPALGAKIRKEIGGKKGCLHISGDHLSNASLKTMHEGKGITKRRYKEVTHLLSGEETLVLVDAGGGAIHGDYHDFLETPGRIAFMHTGLINEELPEGKLLVTSGQVLDALE